MKKTIPLLIILIAAILCLTNCSQETPPCGNAKEFQNGDLVAFRNDQNKGGNITASHDSGNCKYVYDVSYYNSLGRKEVYHDVPADQLEKIN